MARGRLNLVCFRQSVYVNDLGVFIHITHFIVKSVPVWKGNYMVTVESGKV